MVELLNSFDIAELKQFAETLQKYHDDHTEALYWGGPTIEPVNPVTPSVARRKAIVINRIISQLTVD